MDNIVEAFISIAFIVIAFVSWIIRLVGQSREEAQAKARTQRGSRPATRVGTRSQDSRARASGAQGSGAQASRASAQSEIDAFLRNSASSSARTADDDIEIEVIPDEELQARAPADRPRRKAGNNAPAPEMSGEPSEWDRQHQTRREQLRSSFTDRHLETAPFAAEPRQQVEQTMTEATAAATGRDQAEKDFAEARERISAFQTDTADEGAIETSGARIADVVALLRNPRTVKDAIVINEILTRPRGISRRSR